ncbi:MAG: alpha-isopropylmalate synthase regulatory domain-containing protein [Mucinivorans sp.]
MIEIMDTTLRDGEQTSGVSFSPEEKLSVARLLLDEVGVNRLEIASARVSQGERACVERIMDWAKRNNHSSQIEVLGFIDGGQSIDWITSAGAEVVNLLTKGSEKHCLLQLRKEPKEHWREICQEIARAKKAGLGVNIYLEDWSNGMIHSPEYVYAMLEALGDQPIDRFMLPDTLGVLAPDDVYRFCKDIITRFPNKRYDFHAHNDYDLAVANTLAAVKAGVNGIHATVNGLGERAGNAPLASVAAVLKDLTDEQTTINEQKIAYICSVVASYSGLRISPNRPVVGENVFTQCAGIHADGDSKNNLYFNNLHPERFGRTRSYALGKSSGKANIEQNLKALGIELSKEDMARLTAHVVEMGDKKELVTIEDLPYIISELFDVAQRQERVRLLNYTLGFAKGLRPIASLKVEIDGEVYESAASGAGQYDAFMRALRRIYEEQMGRKLPRLVDYSVNIPPGGLTDALVQTSIVWEIIDTEGGIKTMRTRALNADQNEAAIRATLKMLNRL